MKIKVWLAELRAQFLTASVIPILLGTAIAWQQYKVFSLTHFIATLLGGILLHSGANVANDYFDYKNNTDNLNTDFTRPFTGGSRMIQNGAMSPRAVLTESIICYILAGLIGAWLVYECGIVILWLGIIGALSGFFYVAPPFKLVSRGVGEIIIAINFGVLMTLGSYFVQAGKLSWIPVFASLPVAFLITGILYINEFPDYNADKAAGKKHLVVRLGRKRAVSGYLILLALSFLSIIVGVSIKIIPIWGLAALITLPLAYKAAKITKMQFADPKGIIPASVATIQLHLFIGLILSATYIISGLL